MRTPLCILFFLWISIYTSFTQDVAILDSLIRTEESSIYMAVLEEDLRERVQVNPEEVLEFCERWRSLADQKESSIEEAKTLKYQGIAFYYLEKYLEAANTFVACGQLIDNKEETDEELIAECYKNAAVNYQYLELFDLAIDWAKRSLTYSSLETHPNIRVWNYSILGEIYFIQGDYDQSLIYYDSCLQVDKALKDTLHIAEDLSALGRINSRIGREEEGIRLMKDALALVDSEKEPHAHSKALNALGLGYMNNEEFDLAEKYLLEAFVVSQSIRDTNLIINRLINLGELHNRMGNYEIAEGYLLKSMNMMGDDYHARRFTIIYKNLAKVYQQKKEYQKAIYYYDKAHEIAEEKSLLPQMQTIYGELLEIHKEQGYFQKALYYSEKFQIISDSIFSLDARKRAAAFDFNYQAAKKEAALLVLKHANELKERDLESLQLQRRWMAIMFTLLLSLGGLLFYTLRQRQKSMLVLKEAKIKTQLSEIAALQQYIAHALEKNEEPLHTASVSFHEINHLITDPLTEREFEILKLVARGFNNREIADQVCLSVNTIKYHLKNIYTKLEVKNRLQAVQVMMRS